LSWHSLLPARRLRRRPKRRQTLQAIAHWISAATVLRIPPPKPARKECKTSWNQYDRIEEQAVTSENHRHKAKPGVNSTDRVFNRRNILLGSTTLAAASALGTGAPIRVVQAQQPATQPSAARSPNIVFILMDNLGYGELGVYGGGITRGAPTPRIDRLAAEGTRLTNFNVEAQCTPSRSAIMTGRFSIRSGTHSVPIGEGLEGLTQWARTAAKRPLIRRCQPPPRWRLFRASVSGDAWTSPRTCCVHLLGGKYGSGVPGAIGGYFFRLFSNSTTMFMAGFATHVLRSPVAGYSSFGSVIRSNAFGWPSLVGGVHQSRCSS
jgi:hypothetical protein